TTYYDTVAGWDARLAHKGIRLLVLKECPHSHWYLVYLYRPAKLGAALAQPGVGAFLRREGYALPSDPANPAGCTQLLRQLAGRLSCEGDFPDRKSTRLNSSHVSISYAVFCLKKKNTP